MFPLKDVNVVNVAKALVGSPIPTATKATTMSIVRFFIFLSNLLGYDPQVSTCMLLAETDRYTDRSTSVPTASRTLLSMHIDCQT
jgi:hypothetical protein